MVCLLRLDWFLPKGYTRPTASPQRLNHFTEGTIHYSSKEGGLQTENVLFALVLQGLDFLPRREFLGAVIDRAEGGGPETKRLFMQQVEQAKIEFLPSFDFRVGEQHDHTKTVRPDARITTDDTFVVVEAKRARGGRFKHEQLAREYVTTVREAHQKHPLLVLLVDGGPEVKVEDTPGKTHIKQDIQEKLPDVLKKIDSPIS